MKRLHCDIGAYVLDDDGNPLPMPDLYVWGRWMNADKRRVARDKIGSVVVSTVFLGLDHGFYFLPGEKPGPPVLWETMIFGGRHDLYQRRYTSRAAAMKGHARALRLVKRVSVKKTAARKTTK